jgi:hypothetical protein
MVGNPCDECGAIQYTEVEVVFQQLFLYKYSYVRSIAHNIYIPHLKMCTSEENCPTQHTQCLQAERDVLMQHTT